MKTRREILRAGAATGALLAMPAAAMAQDRTPKPAKVQHPRVIYAVRHAEKGAGRDPSLTAEGKKRASALARVLQHVALDAVYSTDVKRTRETASAVARAKRLIVTSYAPFGDGLAKTLRDARVEQTVLVVGHSNTVPALVTALGLDLGVKVLPGYDDLLIIVQTPGAKPLLQRLTYGDKSTVDAH